MTGRLFDGDSRIFKRELRRCRVYGEYGCGGSTLWVARHSSAAVLAVDSSAEWVENVRRETQEFSARIRMEWVGLGCLSDWGYPATYRYRWRFREYVAWPWCHPIKPDLVLIDGRFRVACFLECLLNAKPGTRLIFDDYQPRPHYHLVEEFCPLVDRDGRQALFVVPERLALSDIAAEKERFLYVRD